MKKITEKSISDVVSSLCIKANTQLRKDVLSALKRALGKERSAQAKKILTQLTDNAEIAKMDRLALCQDTGMPVVFVDIGTDIDVSHIDVNRAVNRGIEAGYRRGYFRNSIVLDPLLRVGASEAAPGIVHVNFARKRGLKITVLPKGFGCENKTQLKMFSPTAPMDEIKDFILSVVKAAGPDACPPYILGIGIGGTADYAAKLAKEALLRPINRRNRRRHVARLEKEMLKESNQLDIGPMGLGGRTTVLGVNIETYPTHIAGLPVCVNLSCHALRSASGYV